MASAQFSVRGRLHEEKIISMPEETTGCGIKRNASAASSMKTLSINSVELYGSSEEENL